MAAMVPLKAGLKLTAYPVSSRCIKLTSPSGPERNKKWAVADKTSRGFSARKRCSYQT
jgi:hypothetical protein